MGLSIGIVGLPNVGKSTLFNAITRSRVDAENYPFCTIEPNTGIVPVPDPRLDVLAKISGSKEVIPAAVEFVDIAGLVQGASQGEGLGNKFLSHIRNVNAIAHIVRCFEDENIAHVHGTIDPQKDIEIINLELILADLETAVKTYENLYKKSRFDKKEAPRLALLQRIKKALESGTPVRNLDFTDEEKELLKGYQFLTGKRVIYVANVADDAIASGQVDDRAATVQKIAEASNDEFVMVSADIESQLIDLEENERKDFLDELGIKEGGLETLTRKGFSLLGLQTFLTTGPKETRAWTIRNGTTAPQAAGTIHTDFERGFIRANIVNYDDFVSCGGWKRAREKGLIRQEGKDYVMQEGDVVEFLFNV